jgi:predicted metal-dependent HD superfamily phosphohydrolase
MVFNSEISKLLEEIRLFFESDISKEYVYHSFQHTLDVLNNAFLISKHEKLSVEEENLLAIAAIYHDTGYRTGHSDHELGSVSLAMDYMSKHRYTTKQKQIVEEAILATKVPQNPKNLVAMILCDADLMYLSSDQFYETAELLLKEWHLTGRDHIGKEQFLQMSQNFLAQHTYHTNFGKQKLEPGKAKNLKKIKEDLKDF